MKLSSTQRKPARKKTEKNVLKRTLRINSAVYRKEHYENNSRKN